MSFHKLERRIMTQLTSSFLSKFIIDGIFVLLMILYAPFGMTSMPHLPEINIFDPKINHEFKIEQISDIKCLVIAIILPLLIIIIHFLISKKYNFKYLFISLFGLIYSTVLTSFIILVLKNQIGKPRPDFVARCEPNWVKIEQLIKQKDPKSLGKVIFFNLDICENKEKSIIYEGLRSHPSGHSAISFAGLNYLSLYLLSNSRLEISTNFLCFLPDLLSIFVAITRIQDYRHDYYDIFIGGFIGLLISYVIFNKMFKGNEINYLQEEEVLPLHD